MIYRINFGFIEKYQYLTNQAEILYGYSRDHYLSITHLKLRQGHLKKMHPFWAENGRGHHGGAIWFLGNKPNQKVGSLGIPFGSTIISKLCFPKFQW